MPAAYSRFTCWPGFDRDLSHGKRPRGPVGNLETFVVDARFPLETDISAEAKPAESAPGACQRLTRCLRCGLRADRYCRLYRFRVPVLPLQRIDRAQTRRPRPTKDGFHSGRVEANG